MATYTFREFLAWPIGAGGALRSSPGQRVNVYTPGTTSVPASLKQDGQAVSWATSEADGSLVFTTTDVPVVDLATTDGRFTRRVEAVENIGSGSGGGGGTVMSVTASDSTIVIGGTTANPTVRASVGTSSGTVAAGNHTHTASQVTDFDAAVGSKADNAVLNSAFGTTGGVPIQPWGAPAKIQGELCTVGNLYSNGAFPNLVSGTTSLSVTGNGTSKSTRLIIIPNGSYYYRFSCDYDFTTVTTGWFTAAIAWKNTGDGSSTGYQQVFVSQDTQNPKSGRIVCDIEYPLAPSGADAGLEVKIDLFNNVTGGTATITNISLKAIAGPSRMPYWTGSGLSGTINGEQSYIRYHWDAHERRWYCSMEAFGKNSNTYQYGGIIGLSDVLPWSDRGVIIDPTFQQLYDQPYNAKPGQTGLAKAGLSITDMRISNNDQIFIAQPSGGGAYEYRGNVHGGETLNGSVVAKVDKDDGAGWTTVTGELDQTGIFPARRFQFVYPTQITSTGDASPFVKVDHTFTAFPDGVTRCDRTSTFQRATSLTGVFEWMSSYNTALPRLGRMGRGNDVTHYVDIFTHAAVPAAPTVTTATTGGTLAAGTYSYRVSAVTQLGETLAGPAATVTTTGTTSKTTVAWSAVTNATGYRIYGRLAGTESLLATVGKVTTWDDTGAAAANGAPLAEDTGRVPGSVAQVLPAIDDRATWACWYDPISGWAHGNIYDRESMLARSASGVTGGKAALVSLSGIVKNYNTLSWDSAAITVPSGTVWTATHWSMVWRPEDPSRFHHEIAVRAGSLSALKTVYPTT